MAQDFGDDMGNALLNFVTRQTENYLRFGRGRERAFDWWQRHYKKEGNTPEAAKAMAEKQSSREQVVVPFGTSEEAAYYAQVCRENGTYAAAYTDKQGNGFLAFAKEDAETVAGYAPQFKDVMARLDEQRITDARPTRTPVLRATMAQIPIPAPPSWMRSRPEARFAPPIFARSSNMIPSPIPSRGKHAI